MNLKSSTVWRTIIYGTLVIAALFFLKDIFFQYLRYYKEDSELAERNAKIQNYIRKNTGDFEAQVTVKNDQVFLVVYDSGTCTGKGNFQFLTNVTDGITTVRFIKIHHDNCEALGPGCKGLAYSFSELGISNIENTKFVFSASDPNFFDSCAAGRRIQ